MTYEGQRSCMRRGEVTRSVSCDAPQARPGRSCRRSVNARQDTGTQGFVRDLESAADGARLRFIAHFGLQAIDRLARGLADHDARLESVEQCRRARPAACSILRWRVPPRKTRRAARRNPLPAAPAAGGFGNCRALTGGRGGRWRRRRRAAARGACRAKLSIRNLRFLGPFAGRDIARGIAGMPRACRLPAAARQSFSSASCRSRSRAVATSVLSGCSAMNCS